MKKFTEDHEWLEVDGDTATVGITNYAQNALGDVVFVELPAVGAEFGKADEMAVVESVKAASEVYAPVAGSVVEINEALEAEPALVNSAAEADGWFVKLKLADTSELDSLMDEAAYKAFIADLD